MTRAHGAMLLLGFSLFIGSCSTDPTTSDEYLQLADEKSSVESDLAESLAATAAEAAALAAVETELAASQTELANSQTALGDSQTALSTAEASLDEARTSGADESTRADLAEANAEDLLGQNAELIARAEAISTALRRKCGRSPRPKRRTDRKSRGHFDGSSTSARTSQRSSRRCPLGRT